MPEYRISVPASHAATVIAKNFAIQPVAGVAVEPTTANVAVIIDYCTKLPQAIPVLRWFVKSNPWYEPAHMRSQDDGYSMDGFLDWLGETTGQPQTRLADGLERLRHGIRQLEMTTDKMVPLTYINGRVQLPSGAAWHTAHQLLRVFQFKQIGRVKFSERNLALIVDTSTDVFRLQAATDRLLADTDWTDATAMARRLTEIRKALRVLEIVRDRIPAGAPRSSIVIKEVAYNQTAQELTQQQQRETQEAATRLGAATSPSEERHIIQQWKEHRSQWQ